MRRPFHILDAIGLSVRSFTRALEYFLRLLGLTFSDRLGAMRQNPVVLLQVIPAILVIGASVTMFFVARSQSNSDIHRRYLQMGQQSLIAGDFSAAELCFRRIANEHTENVEAQLGLAAIASQRDDKARARKLMQRLAGPDRRGHPAAHMWLAEDLAAESDSRNVEDRERHLVHVVEQRPNDVKSVAALARLCMEQKRPLDAIEYLDPAYEEHPQLGLDLARAYLSMDRTTEAERPLKHAAALFQKLAVANSRSIQTRLLWAECHLLLRDFSGARDILTTGFARTRDPKFQQAVVKVLVAEADALRQGPNMDLERSLQLLDKAMEIGPGNPYVLNRWALLARSDDSERQRVRDSLQKLLIDGRASAGVHLVLGGLAAFEEDFDQANHHFRLGLLLHPNMAKLLNNYAWSLSHSEPPQLKQALEMANRAVEQTPENPIYRETRGQILAKLERWEEAIADLEQALPAIQNVHNAAEVRDALAAAYDAIDQPEIAAAHRAAIAGLPDE